MSQRKNKYQQIFELLSKTYPNAKSALYFRSPFQLLIAVLLSSQTTDISVNKITKHLFAIAPTPKKMLALGERSIKKQILNLGLYNIKAKHIIEICKVLISKYKSQIPQNRKELEALPGVGRKTANVILNVSFHRPTIAIDTHVFRLANRTKIAVGKTPLEVELQLLKIVPKEFLQNAHYLMLWHGRMVCKARLPECWHCCICHFCQYENKSSSCLPS